MKNAATEIEKILELRFGKNEAQALIFGRARLERMDIQFMDVKHMSELCDRYRMRLKAQLQNYRGWQTVQDTLTDPIERLYGAAEGAILHRRISDELKLWYIAHKDYHAMRRAYLMKCLGPRMKINWDNAA